MQARGLDCQISDLRLSNAVFRAFVWHYDRFTTTLILYLGQIRTVNQQGAIHKQCQQFFRIFDTNLPNIGSFLVLSVNFDQLLTPMADVVFGWPQISIFFVVVLRSKLRSTPSIYGLELNFFGWIQLYPDEVLFLRIFSFDD